MINCGMHKRGSRTSSFAVPLAGERTLAGRLGGDPVFHKPLRQK